MKMTTQKIGIEALGIDEEGGARTSILNLIHNITVNMKDTKFIVYLSQEEPRLTSPNIDQVILPFRRGILARLFLQLFLPFDVIRRKIDLIHFTKSQASIVFRAKMILTIHDLTILQYPEIHSKQSVLYWKYIQPGMSRRMDAIVTVSNDAAKDIHDYFHVPTEKITVVYNTSQFSEYFAKVDKPSRENLSDYSLDEHYLLYVGLLALKKNLETLVRAMKILNDKEDNLPELILIGPRYSDSDAGYIIDLINFLGLSDQIRYLGKLPAKDLFYIFKNATIFLFPSIHEGFGIPCLEAMELGVPLIASKASAIPEVVGDAGILIEDFLSPEKWSETILKLLNNPEQQNELREKGRNRAKYISQNHSYQSVVQLYQNLLSKENS